MPLASFVGLSVGAGHDGVIAKKPACAGRIANENANRQQADGSLYIPEALRPYLGGKDHFDPVA